MNNDNSQDILGAFLAKRLSPQSEAFFETARAEIAAGLSEARFSQLIALASRHARRIPLAPTPDERQRAQSFVHGWDPEHWNLLETLRVALILARTDLQEESFFRAYETAFRFADEGETCAFYRALPLLPRGEQFIWRAGEGCRSNMLSVFCAVACESPYPLIHFDDVAWQQLLMKALFVDVPLWRIHGLEMRLSPTLAQMTLDYMDERTSAGRDIPADAWLLLGKYWDERTSGAVERALAGDTRNRSAAVLALGRAAQRERLEQLMTKESDSAVSTIAQLAAEQMPDAETFESLFANAS